MIFIGEIRIFHWGISLKSNRSFCRDEICVCLNMRMVRFLQRAQNQNAWRFYANHIRLSVRCVLLYRDATQFGAKRTQPLPKKKEIRLKKRCFCAAGIVAILDSRRATVTEIRQRRSQTFVGIYASIVGKCSNYALNRYRPHGDMHEILYESDYRRIGVRHF
jgi:hypothetical protein